MVGARRALIAMVLLTALLAGCGEDDDPKQASGNGIDRAFAASMIPHHESAVDMGRLAGKKAGHAELRALAGDIVRSQTAEIRTLRRAERGLAREGVRPGDLGLDEQLMGMGMDVHGLGSARPFDRAFIDMMVPHHNGAIRMSEIELDRGASRPLRRLARAIVDAQTREIRRMERWRKAWYGSDDAPDVHGEPGGHGMQVP